MSLIEVLKMVREQMRKDGFTKLANLNDAQLTEVIKVYVHRIWERVPIER